MQERKGYLENIYEHRLEAAKVFPHPGALDFAANYQGVALSSATQAVLAGNQGFTNHVGRSSGMMVACCVFCLMIVPFH